MTRFAASILRTGCTDTADMTALGAPLLGSGTADKLWDTELANGSYYGFSINEMRKHREAT